MAFDYSAVDYSAPDYATGDVTFDAVSNSGYQAAQSTYSWSHTCTGSNRFLAVDVEMLSVPGTTVTGITYNSVAMTLIGVKSTISGAGRVECWGLVAPTTGSNSIAVTLSASIASAGTAVSYANCDQVTPTEGFASAQATNVGAADATVSVTTTADRDWVHAACATDDTAITAGNTTRNNVTGALGSGTNEDTNGVVTPAGSQAMTYTNVGALATWAIAAYGIRSVAVQVNNQTATANVATVTLTGVTVGFTVSGQASAVISACTVTLTGVSPAAAGSGVGTGTPNAATVTTSGVSPAASGVGTGTGTPDVATVSVSGVSPSGLGSGSVTGTPGAAAVAVSGVAGSASPTIGSFPVDAAGVTVGGVDVASAGTGTATADATNADVRAPGASTALITISGADVPASGGIVAAVGTWLRSLAMRWRHFNRRRKGG